MSNFVDHTIYNLILDGEGLEIIATVKVANLERVISQDIGGTKSFACDFQDDVES